ncbi:MAG: Gfo/Idh/MocA family oxidoreductase [Anaerolineales bacterium]|nr:Gfo/Idh/MocA family oxidoreductase [Anaerolineales bacterium]
MKFLIAGLGSVGRRHLQNLRALGETDIVLYRSHHSRLPDDELVEFPVETELNAALAYQPQAVVISNPTALHMGVAIPAALAGCHILLEKPVSHTLARVDELERVDQKNGSRILVGYQFRFHPGLQRMKKLLDEGAIGKPYSARAHWGEYLPGWHPWEDYRRGYSARSEMGGGVILTLSHPLDYLRWLFGDVKAVWAFAGKLSDLELDVEDTAEIGLQFDSGLLASLHLDYNQRPPAHTLEIIGTQGVLRWDNADGSVALYKATRDQWQYFPVPAGFERNTLFMDEMRHFIKIARDEVNPVCSLEDGVQALKLCLAALQSAHEGKLVRVPEVE